MYSIQEAYSQAKDIQKHNADKAVVVSYSNYKGYYPQMQNTDLLLVQNTLHFIQQSNRNFKKNVEVKYAND
ncbi:hypothetical protein ACP0SG_01875 [Campylobacter lari]|uniref:hypothetical protein n=2 Tax=Campylobacteraceae TaxID=72294 RepID=UPI003DA19A04